MKEFTVASHQEGTRLDHYLRRLLPHAGDGFLFRMLRKKNIVVNDKRAMGSDRLKAGDCVRLYLSDATFEKLSYSFGQSAPGEALVVLYEDEDHLIVSKPAGLLTQKDEPGSLALSDLVIDYLRSSGYLTENDLLQFRPAPQNRLDRNTSGIVLCGKTLRGARVIADGLRERTIEKRYTALVKGTVDEKNELIAYLRKDQRTNHVTIENKASEGSDLIRTGLCPVRMIAEDTLIELVLFTGKSHQLRAHMAYTGHPIVGDPKYGDPRINAMYEKRYGLRRQFLHASAVTFPDDPAYGLLAGRVIEAPLTDDLQIIIDEAGTSCE